MKTMNSAIPKVLFLCTGNSARSIMAEALLRHWGKDRFSAYSAGSKPGGKVNPRALEILARNHFNTEGLRSKSLEEFEGDNAPIMDFVFTVCDQAANEVCPLWLGQSISAHWPLADPDRPDLSEEEQALLFQKTLHELQQRIRKFVGLPFDKLDKLSLTKKLDDIGRSFPDTS